MFDFSGFEKESPFYNDENKKVIGKMKNELNGEIIEEFLGLSEKIDLLKTKKEEMKKAKRMKKNVVKKDIDKGCRLFIWRKRIYAYHADYTII